MTTANTTTAPTLADLRSIAWRLQALLTSAQDPAGRLDEDSCHLTQQLIEMAAEQADKLVAGVERAADAAEVAHG